MLIGLKLDIGFSEDEICRQLYGRREILPFLRDLGVDLVETPVGAETQPDVLSEHVAQCVDAGLQVTLHPYSEGTIFNPAYFADSADNPCRLLHERFFTLAAEAAQRQQAPTLVNIHGAAGTAADARRHLLDRSIAFFTWARAWCRQNAPEVGVTVELQISPNAGESRQRIGDRYEELLKIAAESEVQVCWDFGHAYWNTYRYDWPLTPPPKLLGRIGHVHCHDVYEGDHEPLVFNTVPWRDFISLLIDNGFDERIILEIPPCSFLDAGGIETLIASVQALRAWTQQCQTGR
ncbi:MAG: sugar phosphate isomerase/epimerase [Phycisphaerales bacterium]|nr:MAG: sugar phosphate isomerase/epimerase [Phycisphaerales bacterium]